MSGRIRRLAAMIVATIGLSGCGTYLQGDLFQEGFFGAGPMSGGGSSVTDRGLAALSKGDYQAAEKQFKVALQKNAKDVYALLGQGIIYQNTGQAVKAREMYEAILAIRPSKDVKFVVLNNITTRPLAEIASVNLALVESGGVLTGIGRGAAGGAPSGYRPGDVASTSIGTGSPVSGSAMGTAIMGRGGAGVPATGVRGMPVQQGAAMSLSGADANIVSRFKTLIALRDQGLITHGEFGARRQANVGALLPLSAPPSAAGLDRPVPTTEQISGRLRAIARALEMGALSVGQHSAERTMILDALMPAAPIVVANPGMPPKGLMEAANAVRRLEFLKADGLVTSDEYSKERAAIEGNMQSKGAVPAKAPAVSETMALSGGKGPQPAIHIASYRSKKAAERGWAEARRKHRALSGLRHDTKRVNLGPRKGTYYRLLAGPLKSAAAAKSMCSRLKRRGQFCQPSFMTIR